jgi:hypothetical protein
MRLVLQCVKEGEHFTVHITEGKSHQFTLPLPISTTANEAFFDMLHDHLLAEFRGQAEAYEHGEYGGDQIGFRMNVSNESGAAAIDPVTTSPVDAVSEGAKRGRQGGRMS